MQIYIHTLETAKLLQHFMSARRVENDTINLQVKNKNKDNFEQPFLPGSCKMRRLSIHVLEIQKLFT